MIRSFKDKKTMLLFDGVPLRGLAPDVQRRARRKLLMLDAAESLIDLSCPPGNRLKKLAGVRADQHCIRINDQWRICFVWTDLGPIDVEIVDYH